MHRLAVVLVNFRTPGLVLEALGSLAAQLGPSDRAVVVDNASGDGSAERIAAGIAERGWEPWARLVRAERNGGFAAGNNLGIRAVEAEFYLLLNSDAYLRPGAVEALLAAAGRHPEAGLLGPRLEWPDETPQHSCFRRVTPISEFIDAAATRILTRAFSRWEVTLGVPQEARACDWVSFACVLIRREVVERVGGLDEGYFMYFEDIEYCRRAAAAGFGIVHDPLPRAVHLRGGSSSVKQSAARRGRLSRYFYRSRARYLASFYGRGGLWAANLLWTCGRLVSAVHELAGRRGRHVAERAWADIWTTALRPLDVERAENGSAS